MTSTCRTQVLDEEPVPPIKSGLHLITQGFACFYNSMLSASLMEALEESRNNLPLPFCSILLERVGTITVFYWRVFRIYLVTHRFHI